MINPIFKIIYDNYKINQEMKTSHGFSCFIGLGDKNILFDTGSEGDILLFNMEKMNIDPESIDIIVLSHDHWDHVDGLSEVLRKNNRAKVYILKSFSENVRGKIRANKSSYIEIDAPLEIHKDIFSTGEMGSEIKEQSLVLNTLKGLVIVTGCAHQGIVEAIKRAKEIFDEKIHLVFGGFHLEEKSESEISGIIETFKELGVSFAGPSHCTGEKAIQMFKDAYKDNFIRIGAGKALKI